MKSKKLTLLTYSTFGILSETLSKIQIYMREKQSFFLMEVNGQKSPLEHSRTIKEGDGRIKRDTRYAKFGALGVVEYFR